MALKRSKYTELSGNASWTGLTMVAVNKELSDLGRYGWIYDSSQWQYNKTADEDTQD